MVFQRKKVAKAIFDSNIPIVSAIGHEIDFTIADFVADLRAPTPSAAAELIIPDRQALRSRTESLAHRLAKAAGRVVELYNHRTITLQNSLASFSSTITHNLLVVDSAETNLIHALENYFTKKRTEVERLNHKLESHNPIQRLHHQKELVDKSTSQLYAMMQIQLQRKTAELERNTLLLDAVSPLAILDRGYSIVKSQKTGKLIRDSKQVQTGEQLEIKLHKGSLESKVMAVKKNQKDKKIDPPPPGGAKRGKI